MVILSVRERRGSGTRGGKRAEEDSQRILPGGDSALDEAREGAHPRGIGDLHARSEDAGNEERAPFSPES